MFKHSTAESQFGGDGIEYVTAKFQFIYWPDKERVGVRSLGGSIYGRKNLSLMSDFVEDQNEETLEITETGLEEDAKEGGEEEDAPIIPVVEPGKSKRKMSKADPKGKCIDLPPEELRKKSMPKIEEVPRRKRKSLLSLQSRPRRQRKISNLVSYF